MSDATEQEQKRPLTLARPGGRLELRKGVETGQVRQSFSHGRSKTVTVEVRASQQPAPSNLERLTPQTEITRKRAMDKLCRPLSPL